MSIFLERFTLQKRIITEVERVRVRILLEGIVNGPVCIPGALHSSKRYTYVFVLLQF